MVPQLGSFSYEKHNVANVLNCYKKGITSLWQHVH